MEIKAGIGIGIELHTRISISMELHTSIGIGASLVVSPSCSVGKTFLFALVLFGVKFPNTRDSCVKVVAICNCNCNDYPKDEEIEDKELSLEKQNESQQGMRK